MASSPSGKRNLYTNNKDYPGCMGGLMHLFDFNQALAGRKLLTDKKPGAGMEVPRDSLDVGGSILELPKTHVERSEDIPYGYGLQRASASRKSKGMPIKALIAQELSKEADSKNRAPSVVARLMGLEALPTDSKAVQKPSTGSFLGKIDEKFMQRPMVERQRHEEIAPHSVRLYAKKSKASAVSGQITPKVSYTQQTESQARKQGSESPGLRNHPQEQQLQEFKKEFEAWQTQKSWANSKRVSRLDDRQVQMPRQQSLPRERELDAKPAVFRENFPVHNMNSTDERLHESREFQDALDFLQSNKEFFMRFLHEPNSLFARHLQENEAESPLEVTKGINHRRSQQSPDTRESSRPPSWERESPLSRQYENTGSRDDSRPPSWSQESPISRSPGGPLGKPSTPHSPVVNNEESLRLHDQRSYPFSPMASQNRSPNSDCHVPTRIVVLKPSPGKVRNLKSTSPAYLRSPKDHSTYDAFSEDNTDVLERLREKLRRDTSYEYNKSGRKNGVLHINEQYRDSSKDPREIAREIARQVRENITRDLMVDPRYVHSTGRKKSVGRRPTQVGDLQDNTYSDGEPRELTNRAYRDGHTRPSRASLQTDKNFDLEAMHGSIDQKADLIELVKRRVSDSSTSQGHNLRTKNIVLDRGSSRRDSHHHFSAGLNTSSSSKGSGEFTVDGPFVSQPNDGSLFYDYTSQVENTSRNELAVDSKHNDLVEQNKASYLEALPSHESDEAENVPELQLGEVPAETVFCSEVVDLERPTAADAVSADLATLDATLDERDNSATAEVKQSSVRIEDHEGPQRSEEMTAVSTEKQQQSDDEGSHFSHELVASFHSNSSEDSQTSTIADDFSKVDSLQANDFKVELVDKSKGEKANIPDNAEIFENDQMSDIDNNDSHAPLDSTPVHTSMTSFSTCESNFIMKPVKEQPEQPSPVSVLDVPFQDESSVSNEFKELSSDLEELRMRLRLLNFDSGNQDLDNDDSLESEVDGGLHFEEVCNVEDDNSDHMRTDENGLLRDPCFNVANWKGENAEMCYIRDVLAASGFTGDSSSVLTQWYAPGQPLNPRLFRTLEISYSKEEAALELFEAASKSSTQEGVLNTSRRHLLFDCANEVLLDILGPYMNRRVWLSSKVAASMPTGKDLVNLLWTHISCSLCFHSGSQETLENLVTKDLGKGSRWLDTGVEIEAAGLDVERAILDDLIEETLLVL
ncbi:hypothetical protein GOP47_0030346 [Adiantum capillus-veneris]|nr:hypothetical protein GOP47_0029790 [Adiantum capillus-veneris]KAI5055201.1 hypothetical protein GOP47_0030346 [Adiantum capillus-veneris]